MKEFSDFEKKIIDKILGLDDTGSLNVLGNILSELFAHFDEYYIEVKSKADCSVKIEESYSLQLLSRADSLGTLKEIIEGTQKDIFKVVKLLDYLDKHDLIYVSGDTKLRDIGTKIHNGRYTGSSAFDIEICELLFYYSSKTILPSHSLKVLKNNNYIGEDEVRHREILQQYEKAIEKSSERHQELVGQYRKTLIRSSVAIFVSLIAVCVSAFVPITTKTEITNQLSKYDISVGQRYLDQVNKIMEVIINDLDGNDTVKFDPEQINSIKNALEMQNENEIKQIIELNESLRNLSDNLKHIVQQDNSPDR